MRKVFQGRVLLTLTLILSAFDFVFKNVFFMFVVDSFIPPVPSYFHGVNLLIFLKQTRWRIAFKHCPNNLTVFWLTELL